LNIIIGFLQKTLFKYVSLLPTYNALKAMSVNILIWLFLRHFLIELTALSLCRGPPPSLNHTNSNLEERILKNYTDSDYAINKYSEGIVYKFADGIVEVTLADYLRDNPGKTEEDFARLKALSDEIYHQQDRQAQRTCRLDVSIHGLEKTYFIAPPAIDTELIQKYEADRAAEAAYHLLHSGKLTEIQKRRFIRHFFQGLSTRQIANLEGVHQRAVWDSLMWAEKKLKKFYKE